MSRGILLLWIVCMSLGRARESGVVCVGRLHTMLASLYGCAAHASTGQSRCALQPLPSTSCCSLLLMLRTHSDEADQVYTIITGTTTTTTTIISSSSSSSSSRGSTQGPLPRLQDLSSWPAPQGRRLLSPGLPPWMGALLRAHVRQRPPAQAAAGQGAAGMVGAQSWAGPGQPPGGSQWWPGPACKAARTRACNT